MTLGARFTATAPANSPDSRRDVRPLNDWGGSSGLRRRFFFQVVEVEFYYARPFIHIVLQIKIPVKEGQAKWSIRTAKRLT